MSRLMLPFALALLGCPNRPPVERGVQLVYRKPAVNLEDREEPIRSVVDRRLAQLKLQANLHEDSTTLTVRVTEGADLARIKALFAQQGHLEFCGEDENLARGWCDEAWPAGVTTDSAGSACSLVGQRRDLERALPDAGSQIAWGPSAAWAIGACQSPRIVSAEVKDQPPSVMLDFDRAGGREFATFTRGLVGRRMVIRLDGVVHSAPLVREAITGGRAMITTGTLNRAEREVLAASLLGGVLPVLVLENEGTWGPPSLRR